MNRRSIAGLAVVVVALVAALIVLEVGGENSAGNGGEMLLPDFAASADAVSRIVIERSGTDAAALVVEKHGDQWLVPARDNYPASIAKIREVMRALAETKIVEAKTANPDLHDRLGLRDPSIVGSKGVKVTASGDGFSASVVFGNTAQGSYRYARHGDAAQAFLVDRNPSLPATAGDWLLKSLLDIEAAEIQSVRIEHPDGEVVAISKETADDSNFTVANIPEGRELSYSTVANGMAGALNDLSLEDVRKAPAGPDGADETARAAFEAFDGRQFVVRTYGAGDDTWIAIDVAAPADGTVDAALRERIAGWQFSVADFKAGLFTRRFEDILKPLPDEE